MTNMVLGSGIPNSAMNMQGRNAMLTKPGGGGRPSKEDELVMETKLKIIQILQVRLEILYAVVKVRVWQGFVHQT